jgi:hypothetical protein
MKAVGAGALGLAIVLAGCGHVAGPGMLPEAASPMPARIDTVLEGGEEWTEAVAEVDPGWLGAPPADDIAEVAFPEEAPAPPENAPAEDAAPMPEEPMPETAEDLWGW